MTDFSKYELIDKFLSGNLSDSEKIQFNKLMTDDSEFATEVEEFDFAQQVIVDQELGSLKAKIASDLNRRRKTRNRTRNIGMTSLGIALLLTVIYVTSNPENKKEQPLNKPEKISDTIYNKEVSVDSFIFDDLEVSTKPTEQFEPTKSLPSTVEDNKPLGNDQEPIETIADSSNTMVSDENTVESEEETKGKRNPDSNINPCDNTTIIIDVINITPACKRDNNGSFSLKATGGTKSCLFSSNGGRDYQKSPDFKFLFAKQYEVIAKDENGCQSKIRSINVPEKVCLKTEYVFNPDYEVWNIPDMGESFELYIKNSSGNIIFNKKYELGTVAQWNGKSINGETAATGLYIFVIKTESGATTKGQITITR